MYARAVKAAVRALAVLACCALVGAGVAEAAGTPAPSPRRSIGETWVGYMNARNLRAACELQTAITAKGLSAVGELCSALPTQVVQHCPKARLGAKPPYRKSEIRTVAEQVGEYAEESPTRGFVRINAQVKAGKQWGTLGLELVAGAWRVTYLRQGVVTFPIAGDSFQSEAWRKLWIDNWCPR
jgi:hypothetical protein